MSNRRITKEQFVNDGTIDGSRIQKALDETEEYINNIPLEAIKQRYSLNYMVFTALGAAAPTAGWGAGGPGSALGYTRFAPYLNSSNLVTGSNYRVKGTTKNSETLAPYDKSTSYPAVFTVATSFPRPVILDSICLFINSRGSASAGAWSDQGLETRSAGDEAYQRVRIIVDTDDMVSSEDRTLNSKEYVLQDFQETFWSGTHNTAGSTMFPSSSEMGGGAPSWGGAGSSQSLLLRKDGLNIPVHQFARTRFRLVLYASDSLATALRDRTPENMTLTVVYKEALRDG